MAQLNDNTTIGGKTLLDFFYPVGTMYYTENDDFNPATQWGGTWEEIEGKFVLGCDSSDRVTSGLTGGEEKHTLTVDEIPSHKHNFTKWAQGTGSDYSGGKVMSAFANGASLGGNSAVSTYNTGGGSSHNNMPPYITAHIWKRTA